jgi:hypothetical protein
MKKYFWIAVAAVIFFSSNVFATPVHYAIFIDAGSTGSRLYLFQYKTGQPLPLIQDIYSESTKRGLSSFANNPRAAGESLKPLLDHVTQELQKKHLRPQAVPINILATAGMRLLPANKQEAIYQNINTYLNNHYTFALNKIATISGKMEGIYGWLDVNYLLKRFQSAQDSTQGSIDMGGASTQIAFSIPNSSRPEDELTLQVGGHRYLVFSKSFLGLGLDQAFSAMNQNPLAAHCYPDNYPLTPSVQGSSNFSSCSSLYTEIIHKKAVAEKIVPVANKQFIAYSGIYYIYNFFRVADSRSQATVERKIQSVCSKTWQELQQEYPQVPAKYLSSFCANGAYLSALLYNSYQIAGKNLIVANQLNQQEIDWTLGALLYQLINSK